MVLLVANEFLVEQLSSFFFFLICLDLMDVQTSLCFSSCITTAMCSNVVGSKLKNGKESFGHVTLYMQYLFYSDIAITYRIVGNFRWCRFIFARNECVRSDHTPTSWSLCNNGPVCFFSWRPSQLRRIQRYWFRLRQLRRVSYGFVGILYISRLILFYSDNSEGRQTAENHLAVRIERTHIMTSSIMMREWEIHGGNSGI